ncbi:MAG: M15 family metallopeptidase [Lachnospiraceae bacterium]|nr:M15 family metallopeptidase [Lachnospiraceae bacterium]
MNVKKTVQTIGLLILLIGICAVIIRIVTGSETLSEYASKQPAGNGSSVTVSDGSGESSVPAGSPDEAKPSKNSAKADAPKPSEAPSPTPSLAPSPTPAPDPDSSFMISELSDGIKKRITGISYPADDAGLRICYDDLRYLSVLYYDFNGEVQTGELICNRLIAGDLIEIFRELYENEYQIEKIRLVDEYGGDDLLSMLDDNTSCFNYRLVENTTSLSKHALGLAIDVNPFYNPYIVYGKGEDGGDYISPAEAAEYVDRSRDFPHKIDENDLCCRLFKAHGFTWGGDWTSQKDYQHFQKTPE